MRLLVALTLLALTSSAEDRPPNVVLIVADDLGYADLSCYGSTAIRTPALDRLARQGTKFTNFCVAQAVCTASRAGLLTGCYPNRVGLAGALNHTSTVGIHPDEELLSELFKARGYATACFGKWHLGTKAEFLPTRHGFDRFVGLPYSNDNGPRHPTLKNLPPLPLYRQESVQETDPDQSKFTSLFTEEAVKFVTEHRQKPFFLYLPHVMPHVPVAASMPFAGKSKAGAYGDAVEELDDSTARLMKTLADLKLEQDTIVIFLSDNGPFLSYGEHAGSPGPFREGKLTAFEGGVRVPLIVRWPGKVPEGKVCGELVTGLDLLPTLAVLCSLELPKRAIDGADLSALWLGGRGATGRKEFAYYSGGELHAVRKGNWKLHLPHDYLTVNGPPGRGGQPANFANMKPAAIEESGVRGIATRHGYRVEKLEMSLYNLDRDPGESRNLMAEHPEIVKDLLKYADTMKADLGDTLTDAKGRGVRPVGQAAK